MQGILGHLTFPCWLSWHLFIEHPSSSWEKEEKNQTWPATLECAFGLGGGGKEEKGFCFWFFFAFSNQEGWTHGRITCQMHDSSFINLIIENKETNFLCALY